MITVNENLVEMTIVNFVCKMALLGDHYLLQTFIPAFYIQLYNYQNIVDGVVIKVCLCLFLSMPSTLKRCYIPYINLKKKITDFFQSSISIPSNTILKKLI